MQSKYDFGPLRQRCGLFNSAVFYSFFFSSRRRHTRFDCDWSSDVCSSDLVRSAFEVNEIGQGKEQEELARERFAAALHRRQRHARADGEGAVVVDGVAGRLDRKSVV